MVLANAAEVKPDVPQERRKAPSVAPTPVSLPVFDRLVTGWPDIFARKLAEAWSLRVTVTLMPVAAARLSSAITALEPALIGVVRCKSHPLPGALAFCRASVFGLTDRALGGPGRAPTDAALKRPVTPIEAHLVQSVAAHALNSLAAALAPAGELHLSFGHWAQPADRLSDVREGDMALVLTVQLDLPSGPGTMTLVLPLALLEPIRPALAATYPGEAFGTDAEWKQHLMREVSASTSRLCVVLGDVVQPLSRIQSLSVGDTLAFECEADPVVTLRAGAVDVASGRLGRANGRVAFRFESSAGTVRGNGA